MIERVMRLLLGTILVALLASAAAQTTVSVAESDTYGPYLTDAEGNALYLFVNEEMDLTEGPVTEGVRAEAVPCEGGCLEAWPPITGEATAGEGVDPELLYNAEFTGMDFVVYNGWPLYYFARDEAPGDTNGQGVGGAPNIWYLVTPSGEIVEATDAE